MSKVTTDHLASVRQADIRQRLTGSAGVIAADLAREFRVSEDTIRRDLRALAKAGDCVRVHGGALPVPAIDRPLSERMNDATETKGRLAKCMAGLLNPGQSLFIDAGTTGIAFAKALPHGMPLTVFTHAPHIAAVLMDIPSVNLIVIGGKVDPRVGAAVGTQSIRELQQYRPDIAVIGACAVDIAIGVTAFDADDAMFKRVLVEQCPQRFVASTDEKIATVAPFPVMPISAVTQLVVSSSLDHARLEAFRASAAQLHVA